MVAAQSLATRILPELLTSMSGYQLVKSAVPLGDAAVPE
jgi:hypothetical protein